MAERLSNNLSLSQPHSVHCWLVVLLATSQWLVTMMEKPSVLNLLEQAEFQPLVAISPQQVLPANAPPRRHRSALFILVLHIYICILSYHFIVLLLLSFRGAITRPATFTCSVPSPCRIVHDTHLLDIGFGQFARCGCGPYARHK
jgi:hypothetical protein